MAETTRIKLRRLNKLVRDLGGITNNMELSLVSPTRVTTGLIQATMDLKSYQGGKVCVVRDDYELDLIVRGVKLAYITFVPYSQAEMRITVFAENVTDTYQEVMLQSFITAFTVLASRLAKKELDLKAMFDYEPDED